MAFQIADLYASMSIRGAGETHAALGTMQSRLKSVEQSFQGVARMARRMFLVMAGAVTATIKFASDAEEVHSKFLAVFKEEAGAAKAWGDAYAGAIGRARMDMEKFLSSMQDTFVPLGFMRTKARELSQQVVKLGLDLASFNNVADDEALRDLQSALVGNHETVRKYGVIITEATLKQELLTMGIKKSYLEVSNQEKVLARLAIMVRSTTDAQGDALRTAGSFANQMRALKGQLKDTAAAIGKTLLPTLQDFLRAARPLIAGLGEWAAENQKLAATFIGISLGILAIVAVLPQLVASLSIIAAHPAFAVLAVTVGLVLAKVIALKMELASLAAQIKAAPMGTAIEGKSREATEKALALLQQQRKAAVEALEALEAKELPEVVHGAMFGAVIPHEALADIGDELAIARGEVEGFDDAIKKVVDTLRKMDEAATNSAKAIDKLETPKARLLDIDIKETWWDVQEAEIDKLEAAAASYIDAARTPFENFQNTLEEINGLLAKNLLTQEQYAASAELARKAYEGTLPKVPTAAGSAFTGVEEMTRRIQEAAFQKDQEKETVLNTAAIKDNTKELKQFPFALETIAESWAVNTGMTMGP